MIKHKQLNKHDPDNGIWGDCGRTAIACLLDLFPEDVPHFFNGISDDAIEQMDAWIKEQGLTRCMFPIQAESVKATLNWAGKYIENCHYILLGTSKNGTNHVVVCYNKEIVHDPAQDDSGIIGPADDGYYWIEILAKTL